jgi:peroxiredoxin Q/BCP
MLEEGKKAPAFTLESAKGKVSLADFHGKYLVLYFYPKDLTPGCTLEAIGFRDARAALKKRNAEVVGVSRDTIALHEKFATKCELPFPLLSDPDGKVIRAYGAWGEKNMYGKKTEGILRSTVIIGPDGKVAKVFPKVKAAGHAEEIIAALDEL